MATIKELKEQRTSVIDRAKARIDKAESEGRTLNDEELKGHVADEREIKQLGERIERQESISGWQAENPAGAITDPPNPANNPPRNDPDRKTEVRVAPAYARYGRLKNFPQTQEGLRDAYIAGQWLAATVYGNRNADQWCRDNGVKIEMAQTEGTNTAGGYLVIPEFERAILDVRDTHGIFSQYAESVALGSNQNSQPKRTGVLTAYWVDEGVAPTESQTSWGNVVMSPKTLGAWSRVSSELEQDAFTSVVDNLAFEIGMAFAYSEDYAGFLGDGSATYGHHTGVVTKVNDGNHTASVYTAATGHTAYSTLTMADFEGMLAKAPEWLLKSGMGAWYISAPGFWSSMARLADAAGGNTKADFGNGVQLQFLGYPVRLVSIMNSTLTAQVSTNGLCLFGDLRSAAKFGRRKGVTIDVARELYIANRQIAVFGHERVAINVHTLDTYKQDGTVGSGPIISLSTPAS